MTEATDLPEGAEPLGMPADRVSPLIELVERWWSDHFPGSPVAAVTAAWNHAFAAKEELKRRLGGLNSEEN